MGEVSSLSVEPFWRFLKVFSSNNHSCQKHVTYEVIGGEVFVPHELVIIPVKIHLNLFSRFGEDF